MEKQYVLSETEYVTLCNRLESLTVSVSTISRNITEEQKDEMAPLLITMDNKLNRMMKALGWRE